MTEDRPRIPHPYVAMKASERDLWIDRFRSTLLQDESDMKVIVFLAKYWHFFDRSTPTEECMVKRQCFIDLLICCGVWENEVFDQSLLGLLRQEPKSARSRICDWFKSFGEFRVSRTITQPQNKDKKA